MVALAVRGVVPQTDLTGDLAGRRRRVARYDLHGDTRVEAGFHRCGHIPADRIRDGGHRREMQTAGPHRRLAVAGLGLGPCDGQRAHRTVLEGEQPLADLRAAPVVRAHRPHDLRSPLHAKDAAARDPAANDRSHVFAFGREGQAVLDFGSLAQRGIIFAAPAEPFEQRTFGRIADDTPLGIEKSRGVRGHDLGEIVQRQRVVTHHFVHVHLVLRQRTGLVGADDRYGSHRLAGMHPPHEVVRLEHPAHRHSQRKRDAHRQPFGHGHHDQRHGHHKYMEHLLHDPEPILFEQPADEDRLEQHRAEDHHREHDADTADHARQTGELPVERRLLVALDGRLFRYAARLGRIAHGRNDHHAVAVHYGRTAHHDVRRIGRLGIEMFLGDRLRHLGFARERRFVDAERHGLDQLAVRRHRLAVLDAHQIAHDHLPPRHLAHGARAHHFHGSVVVHLIQPAEAPHGVPLEDESHARGQNDGANDADRFEELLLDEGDYE